MTKNIQEPLTVAFCKWIANIKKYHCTICTICTLVRESAESAECAMQKITEQKMMWHKWQKWQKIGMMSYPEKSRHI